MRPPSFVVRVGLLALLGLAWGACGRAPRYPLSGHSDGERFLNPGQSDPKSFGDFVKWQWSRERGPWPEHVENTAQPHLLEAGDRDVVAATWIGHASFLVQIGRANVLTDPIFSARASPVSWAGPARVRAPGLTLEALPPVHAVVVSHNHYDHMDLPSLVAIDRRFHPLFVVPLGNGELLRSEGIHRVVELDWWEATPVPEVSLTVTLAPALHWSTRTLTDRFEALWGSYMLRGEGGYTTYFAGDTGYAEHFRDVRSRLGAPDLALLPIGAYAPRWFMRDHHLNPSDAVQALLDLGARFAVPMHYATFRLADDGFDEPLVDLAEARRARGVPEARFPALPVGATFRVAAAP